MKRSVNIQKRSLGVIVGLFFLFLTLTPGKTRANTAMSISFEVFYENLAPHGNWINDMEYGYIWAPRVGPNFRPYHTEGYWVNTVYGNMWVSHYDWGWAPFHYGRWTLHSRFGWVWVPGYEWGPAWVSWRQGGGYYGWAPLGPGISINVSLNSGYYVPDTYWTFVPYRNLYSTRVYSYHVASRAPGLVRNTTIINNTYVDNRVTYVSGPSSDQVRRTTGRAVRTYDVANTNTRSTASSRVSGNTVSVYRPESTRRNVSTGTRSTTTSNPVGQESSLRSTGTTTTRTSVNTSGNNSRRTTVSNSATQPSTRTATTNSSPATRSSGSATTTRRTSTPAASTANTRRSTNTTSPSVQTRTSSSSSVRSTTPTTRSSSVRSSNSSTSSKSVNTPSRRR